VWKQEKLKHLHGFNWHTALLDAIGILGIGIDVYLMQELLELSLSETTDREVATK
jgi:hypothetical protein